MNSNEIVRKLKSINPKIKVNKKMIQEISSGILSDEEILYVIKGDAVFPSNMPNLNTIVKQAVVILTNKRVFAATKSVVSCNSINIPIENIKGITANNVFFRRKIAINNNGMNVELIIPSKEEANKLVGKINEQLDNYKSFKIEVNKTVEQEITEQIEKLSDLYKEGILTEYEFATKKMELLEKLKK